MIATQTRQPALFLSHGGGPWPFMDGEFLHSHDALAEHLASIPGTLHETPRAIAIVSAHWDAPVATINTGAAPPMLYDYRGFPEHTYRVKYAAPGAPDVAIRVSQLLASAGIASRSDGARGYDHGVFVPLSIVFPDAAVPVVQLSLRSDMDPAAHLAIGRALAPLRDEGVVIVGSGMTFHNMRAFFEPSASITQAAAAFDAWLAQTMLEPDTARRDAAILRWLDAPGARIAHPTPEHLLPLFVVAGAANDDAASRPFAQQLLGFPVSGFRFG